jgi:hypothetical protein
VDNLTATNIEWFPVHGRVLISIIWMSRKWRIAAWMEAQKSSRWIQIDKVQRSGLDQCNILFHIEPSISSTTSATQYPPHDNSIIQSSQQAHSLPHHKGFTSAESLHKMTSELCRLTAPVS